MKKKILFIAGLYISGIAIVALFTGCPITEKSPIGFRLPEGNGDNGKAEFVKLGCIKCHSISGVDFGVELPGPRDVEVVLGGEVARVKTYGQLVTSIINPSHVISPEYREKYTDADGKSSMPDFTKEMTVRQMIDLTEFLQDQYTIVIPDHYYGEY